MENKTLTKVFGGIASVVVIILVIAILAAVGYAMMWFGAIIEGAFGLGGLILFIAYLFLLRGK